MCNIWRTTDISWKKFTTRMTGGGGSQVGTGMAPLPGEEGFTGNVA